jgi:hypothetical protein
LQPVYQRSLVEYHNSGIDSIRHLYQQDNKRVLTVHSHMIKKHISAIILALILSLYILHGSSLDSKVLAQNTNTSISNSSSDKNLKTSNSTPVTANWDSFLANGSISSLIFVTHNASKNNLDAKNSTDLDGIKKFILSGEWILKVDKGKATDFNAKFTKVLNDGSKWHTHEIKDFKPFNESSNNNNNTSAMVYLTPDKSISLAGTANIMLNGTSTWNNVNLKIQIANGKTITITPDNQATSNHFQGQPIYGNVLSIKDATGNELLGSQQKILRNLYQ